MEIIFPGIHLFTLLIAPQLWYAPVLNLRTDYILYPIWFLFIFFSNRFSRLKFDPQVKFFIFWLIWISLSLITNGVFFERFYLVTFFYTKWFVLFLLISASMGSINDIKAYIIILVFLSAVLAIEGIDHSLSKDGIGWAGQTLGWSEGSGGRTQWVGIFDGPGVFCVAYTIALPFILTLFSRGTRFSYKIIAVILSSLFFGAIWVNGSRGGLLTVFAILGMHFSHKYFLKNKIIAVFIGCILIFLFSLLPSHFTDLSDSHHSGAHRVEMWAEGCEMLKFNPIFGIGRLGFASYTGKLIAHNSFVEIMGETGAVGLFAWLGLIYFSLKKLYLFIVQSDSIDKDNDRDILLVKALFISICGYLISAMFVTLEYETLYMLLALCAVVGQKIKDPIKVSGTDIYLICSVELAWIIFINGFTLFLGPQFFR